MRPSSQVCASVRTLRKSGTWQTSHSSAHASGPCTSGRSSPSAASASSARWSSAWSQAHERVAARGLGEAREERVHAREVEVGLPPEEALERTEAMRLDRFNQIVGERPQLGGRAERAVAQVAPARPAICATSAGRQRTRAARPSYLCEAREGHVVDVEVEAHADRVGGDQVVHLARLVERDLGVARPRRQRAEHDGRAAALPAQALGHRVDVRDREHDDRAAPGQPIELLRADVAQRGQPRRAMNAASGTSRRSSGRDGVGAQEHRLLAPARVQQAVREDVPALAVGAELDLVHGQELDRPRDRHGLDRAHEVARARRHQALLARHQRDRVRAPRARDDAVVVLAGQQSQGEADHPRAVLEQALDARGSVLPVLVGPRRAITGAFMGNSIARGRPRSATPQGRSPQPDAQRPSDTRRTPRSTNAHNAAGVVGAEIRLPVDRNCSGVAR